MTLPDSEATDPQRFDPRLIELQSALDGEGRATPAGDDEAQALAVLSATREALDELALAHEPPRPARSLGWLMGLAAAAVVAVVGVLASDGNDEAVHAEANSDDVEIRVERVGPGHGSVFDDMRVRVELKMKQAAKATLVYWKPGQEESELAASFLKREDAAETTPLVMEVQIEAPDGTVHAGRTALRNVPDPIRVAKFELSMFDVFVPNDTVAPIWSVRPTSKGFEPDDRWTWAHFGMEANRGWVRFAPTHPGVHKLKITVRSMAIEGRKSIDPVTVETTVAYDGIATPWSEPVDGMRARLLVGTTTVQAGPLVPLGLQIENVGKRARTYNVMGSTMAKIPQPWHMHARISGEDLEQRRSSGLMMPGSIHFTPHQPNKIRTIVLGSHCWKQGDGQMFATPGSPTVSLSLHFEPTLVAQGSNVWIGEVSTPELRFHVRKP